MRLVHRHRWVIPYLLLAPGLAWLALFFLVPLGYLGHQSLETYNISTFTSTFDWAWHNYADAVSQYHTQLLRSFAYAAVATALALGISYPLAYWIAFRGGRWKNVLLLIVVAPFFVTFLVRTLAWETILGQDGWVVGLLDHLHLMGVLGQNGHLLASRTAVISGITYNFLPFMVLPLYVSLEQIDARLVEAAQDLYASRARAFWRVTLPLSLPGVFAGTLLTFIPAAGDYVNAQLLGGPKQQMIGNVIQDKFLGQTDYGAAAALAFVLMVIILALVAVYTRALGTERLTG